MITLEFLGTATSTGVPVIGCDCDVCRSDDPRDTRLRSSVLIHVDDVTLLIDTSPDLRFQMLRSHTRHIDGVLFTHMHADHTAGIDEMRRFNYMQQAWIPAWVPEDAAKDLQERFAYAFRGDFKYFGMSPDLELHVIEGAQPFEVAGVAVQPIPIMHGTLPILGYRIGDIAYLTDVKTIPAASMPLLQDLDILVLTALRKNEHPAHMSLDEALAAIAEIKPKRAFLSHIAHEMGKHAEVEPTLPTNLHLAWDGLRVGTEQIAIISDVHGNMTAYDAVLADIEARGIRRIINLGDVTGKGPRGSEAVARTQKTCEATVRGNWDEHVGRPDLLNHAPMRWWHDELSAADREWLTTLPYAIDLEFGGRQVRLLHASATGIDHRVFPDSPEDEFTAMFGNTDATGEGPLPDIVIYGDIHVPYADERDGRLLLNAGSVGNPLDEPSASYLILKGDPVDQEDDSFRYELVRVPYDIETEIACAEESGMLAREEYAFELRTGVYRGLRSARIIE